MEGSVSIDGATQVSGPSPRLNRGGWVTFPFFIATMAGLTLGANGWLNNVIVYQIQQFNIKSIDAAQFANILTGCTNVSPIIAAIFADSFLGSFGVISISCLLSLLGLILLALTALLDPLRPPSCEAGARFCQSPSKTQLAVLYTSLALASFGSAGTQFTLAAMGAGQFANPNHQRCFFNWHFFTYYVATLVSLVGIIYIEDNLSWALGFALCAVANLLALVIFVLGRRYYCLLKPQGSPYTALARVMVAAFHKRNVLLSSNSQDYCHEPQEGHQKMLVTTPSNNFKFLNRAAILMEGDTNMDGIIVKPWNLCTLRQVEDLKTVIKLFPLWSTGILLCTPIAIQISLIVLQALAMDRHIGPHLQIPAGSMIVFVMITTSIVLATIDRFIIPLWKKLTRRPLTLLQRIGFGHSLTILSMAISALVESRRLNMAHTHKLTGNTVVPMSALWLVPQLVVVGTSEGFHLPGQVSLYYQEFPESLKSTAAAMVAVFIGIAFYLSTAVLHFLRKTTGWLPNGINDGRMDNVYWVSMVIGIANFGYYLVCACFYMYQNVE